MNIKNDNVSQIVLPVARPAVEPPPAKFVVKQIPKPRFQQWAPAWFYSALNWLGKSYYDASNVLQMFNSFLAGSDVDPYQNLGATRLFQIVYLRDEFRLTLAADVLSPAPASGGTTYPNTDDGIRDMYLALSASPIFAAVKYCYVPGRIGSDLNPNPSVNNFDSGYDPATGLRSVVLGTAVSQVVPLGDFTKGRNEQIYDDNPAIVPLVTALVYDVTQHNTLGATTFVLPVYYTRDQVTTGSYYVSRLGVKGSLGDASVDYGQAVVYQGGPGYSAASATQLKPEIAATLEAPDHNFTVYTYATAKAYTVSILGTSADIGVTTLTYTGSSPQSIFSGQRIIGFYRDASWKTCLGAPIYDYGQNNQAFTATTAPLNAPVTVYDPTSPFLNGGTLQGVVSRLAQATYIYAPDRLVSILETAISAENSQFGVGLSVTSAGLDFTLSSTPGLPIVDGFSLPVTATATTAQPAPSSSVNPNTALAVNNPIPIQLLNPIPAPQPIGSGGNAPGGTTQGPVTIQVPLNASIPREALDGTGIRSFETGTVFPEQSLGSGSAFAADTGGTVLNLMAAHPDTPTLPPYDLSIAASGVAFAAGVYYVVSATGTTLSMRGSNGASETIQLNASVAPEPAHTYVGAMIYTAGMKTVRLYPKLQLTLPAPAVGTQGVLQGEQYAVRLTFGASNSVYDIVDVTEAMVASKVTVPNPVPADKSNPQPGDLYFGSFIGGSDHMNVWSIPVFLTVAPSLLPGAGFNGNMVLDAQVNKPPAYSLITDSSLFVYSNINIDTGQVGSVSSANVYVASAAINTSPDDLTSQAFAPCKLVMGLVRQAVMGTNLKYVFVPEDDSILIGQKRYMVSVINLDAMGFDPNTRPYPPVFWPQSRFWQFANRHNPYIDVRYTGSDQTARVSQAQSDTARISLATAQAKEPMHLYLDTNGDAMTVWPIYPFPLDIATQSVDQGKFKLMTDTILQLLQTNFPSPSGAAAAGPEQVSVPPALNQNNPYTVNAAATPNLNPAVNESITMDVISPSTNGVLVTNLNPAFIANPLVDGIQARQSFDLQQSQQANAELAVTKSSNPALQVMQNQAAPAASAGSTFTATQHQPVYGFSVYNLGTGEAYIVELVQADLDIPDQLPQATENATYDPYYVRVVFLNTLTCYNMSIIVPAMVHDQYGHLASYGTAYGNVLSKTDELALGYMYSLYDSNNNFDALTLTLADAIPGATVTQADKYLYTNIPYLIDQNTSYSPLTLFEQFSQAVSFRAAERAVFDTSKVNYISLDPPPVYFVCRRKNWSADCHLMQSTHPSGSMIYMAFGGGDIVPIRLDLEFQVDKRPPAHLYKLTYTFADKLYDSAKTISVGNKPYVVAVTTNSQGVTEYTNFSIDATAGTADLQIGANVPLSFPTEIYVVGQASATLISVSAINALLGTGFSDTGNFMTLDDKGAIAGQEFQLVAYNNLVYLVRAVSNFPALGAVGGLGVISGLLIDTFVPTTTGNLALAQAARHKRSGLSFFGTTYTPTTMVDTLDELDFTSITGEFFFTPTIFIPIPELDASKGFIADISNFLGQQIWTLIYPEIWALQGTTVNGVPYPTGFNLDVEKKPVLSLQKLHFVYDPQVVMFTPNDLTHKYPLQPKQQMLALTNGQIQEGICWRSANVQPQREAPFNVCAQQILPPGIGMDRPNIVYSKHNRAVTTANGPGYLGMSVNSFRSVSGVVYNIEESALPNDQTATGLISAVSAVSNMLIGVLFDYDNNDQGTLSTYDPDESTKGVVFLNGYLGSSGYSFSSPDHFDVNDVLPSQLPLLEQIASILGFDVAFFDYDVSLPRQFWSLTYDSFTAPGVPNFVPNLPPSVVDPTFSNRTRSLILSIQNPVHPTDLGLMDTYSSVVSAGLHLRNGVTGSVFLSKKADRDIASIGSTPAGSTTLFGLPTKYDFFIFSQDHYTTLKGAAFELIDLGYAMSLVDDGSGTGTKIAKYLIDADGNYNELYSYVLYSPNGGILESATFTLKVTLGAPANLSASPIIPETPNNVNPQDLVAQINKLSSLVYAAMGPSSTGLAPAFIPIQAVGGAVQAAPLLGPPGFNGYALNVIAANRQPVQISQIYSGNNIYAIAGSTTIVPVNPKTGKALPLYGSISHGLDRMVTVGPLPSTDQKSFIPRTPGSQGLFGGNGLGALITTPSSATLFSWAFQGVPAIPAPPAANPGSIMKADDTVLYTYNGVSNTVMDSTGKSASVGGGQYFVDITDTANPIYAVVTWPKFTLNGATYTVNLSTTLTDGSTSCYTLVVGGKSYLFDTDNAHVTVDLTTFTFNKIKGGNYTVSYASVDAPVETEAPSPVALAPFSITAANQTTTIDVFNKPGDLKGMSIGVIGRLYTYDPVQGTVAITQNAVTITVPVATGMTFASSSGYGYVIGFANGTYTLNGSAMYPYAASLSGAPASYSLMTAPKMFTIGGNFYCFNQDPTGAYVSVTGNGQTYPVNPYQFSINGAVYIINTNAQPNTVIGGGNVYTMTAGNSQFLLNGVQYTIALKQSSLNGATISGQFNITQGNVVVVENYVYQLDTLNGQIVGNGSTYPLTTSGFTYTITTADRSFTVTTEPNATTVTIGNIVYLINNTTVVGDGVTYPILPYRTFVDGAAKFVVGLDGTVSVPPPFTLTGAAPWTKATFTDGSTYTVNDIAAYDGTKYYLMSGSPSTFTAGGLTYTIRADGVAINAGPSTTYIIKATGAPNPNQFAFGTKTISFGRAADVAAFDGQHFYAIANGSFTDTITGLTYTLSGNTAVHEGNSYEIFSNLGQTPYFQVPGGPTYYVSVPVADTGSASGDLYSVFPIASGQFTIPLVYTIAIAGAGVTVNAITFSGPTAVPLTTAAGALTGGSFTDPVTKISYMCVNDGGNVTFVDSNGGIYPFSAAIPNAFVANVVVTTAVNLALDSQPTPAVYPIASNQFTAGAATYSINSPIAYTNPAGPYYPMINGRFIVPKADPVSSIAYAVKGGSVTKGYVLSGDDEFSPDGSVVYTVNAVNVVKASNQPALTGASPSQTLVAGSATYMLDEIKSLASIQPAGLAYNFGSKLFTVSYNGLSVTYTVSGTTVTDSRKPANVFNGTMAGAILTFTDTLTGVTFSFDSTGSNPITVGFVYTNHFFIDLMTNVTYDINEPNKVEAISYLPETTQYAFVPADGKTYLIHYNNVGVVFPVISGANVNAGVASVGSDTFTVKIDEVDSSDGGTTIPINRNSFEINGNLYTITGSNSGPSYLNCKVVGDAISPKPFLTANTFQLTDPAVTYTLQLDAANLPVAIVAAFAVMPSRNLITVNDDVYLVTYYTVSTGTLLGQGQASIAITNSSFTLSNPFDSTKAKFIFADLNIFDAASVVGQFTVYSAPTFFIGSATYTYDTVNQVVTDNNKRPFPLIPNPTMFSINGFNYLIDTNRVPHAIVGNNNVSPIATDVTVEGGKPIPNTTFTLNGLIYKYTEDLSHNLLTITGTKSYMVAQPALTFKLDSSLIFTINPAPPSAGSYVGSVAPIGTVISATGTLNLYPGTPESGGLDFFTYKNVLYTMVKSGASYVAVQKSYTVYVSAPVTGQQQLAVFDLNGTTYMVTDGATKGVGTASGINPGTLWAATATSGSESQFGLVYGFTAQPTNVSRTGGGVFQFQVIDSSGNNTLYDIVYTAGGNANVVKVDVPSLLPSFTQAGPFSFTTSYPLTFETGGYNAFTTFVDETATPSESFAGAYRTPLWATNLSNLVGQQGDFSVEFWHSLPVTPVFNYHPFTFSSGPNTPLVFFVDVNFIDTAIISIAINNTMMLGFATPPVFSSGWRHFALTYTQPYTMFFQGAGYEVQQATNYNFGRDFSIAMTFSASDVSAAQGLLYKGTGSDVTAPELRMSYQVGIEGGNVTLAITEGTSMGTRVSFVGPPITADPFFQVIIVKNTVSLSASAGSTDPYAPPFDINDLTNGLTHGTNAGIKQDSSSVQIFNIQSPQTPKVNALLNQIQQQAPKSYNISISVRPVNNDGTVTQNWTTVSHNHEVSDDSELTVMSTGPAHLLFGTAFDEKGNAQPLGGAPGAGGNIRDVFLFNNAIDITGIRTAAGIIDIANASSDDLLKAGLIGCWKAAYDPNGVVNNPYDQDAVAISTNTAKAFLLPLTGHEFEGTALFVNGVAMQLFQVSGPTPYNGSSLLNFNAGLIRLEEISVWRMARQAFQVIDDMFGRLIPTNEPTLIIYLSGAFQVQAISAPILPMNKYIDNIRVVNPITVDSQQLVFPSVSLDLSGCPSVGRCGPLVSPNLYTPPGVALTVCDTPPSLTTYSVTLNGVTSTLAGELNEAYVFIKDNVLTLFAGKKVGDLVLTWVSQEQGDVQVIGYIEGAPPCPMTNMTNKPGSTYLEPNTTYPGATSITMSMPASVSLKYKKGNDHSGSLNLQFSDSAGVSFKLGINIHPFGFGVHSPDIALKLGLSGGLGTSAGLTKGTNSDLTSTNKLDELKKFTVKLEGTLTPYTGDLFMASLNTLTTPSTTPGNPSSKTAILPNPNLGGFTTSNPAGALPKTAPTEEKFGMRMYQPSPYGQAFVSSETLDVYQQTLLQSNTVYGFVRVPNPQIPRDLNIVSFRMSSKYIRPGCLDGVIGYVYNPATLPTGAQTYTTSTGQMQVLYDKNFSPGQVGHNASYMRVVEAYRTKKEVDQQAFNAVAIYQTAYKTQGFPNDSRLTPALDFYNEYIWSSRGGAQEVKHSYATSYEEVYTTSTSASLVANNKFEAKIFGTGITLVDVKTSMKAGLKETTKYVYSSAGSKSFDAAASFDGIETDTQMRYTCNNDAHFVMNYNSMFNPNNQSGLNLVIGSDGLVYNIVPSVSSGAGLPMSDNVDDSLTYTQPQPAYTSGNADGLTGALEPYDRPGKTKLFRTYAFFLQPSEQNAEDFWNTVVDPMWLANSPDSDADAMRTAMFNPSIPWRLMYRVTYSERYLPPLANASLAVPQITPVMAIPVVNSAADFLFQPMGVLPRPAHNPANDLENNIVLTIPTATGASAGGSVLPNNVIPFDLVKTAASIVNWGDSANAKILTQLLTSVLGLNTVLMSFSVLPGSTKVADIKDLVSGAPLYTIYTDPNGLTVNVPANASITVYQDVNSNPIQYFDGKAYHSLQADYVASPDGTLMYYIQPPSTYDQSKFDLVGDYDLFGHPGDEWRYYLVSGMSADMTAEPVVTGYGPFLSSSGMTPYTGLSIAPSQHTGTGQNQVAGYILAKGILQWPHLNTNAETFADVAVYKAMSLLDTFPIGDPEVLIGFLQAQYPGAPFISNDEICLVFARNVVSYFNASQLTLIPQ